MAPPVPVWCGSNCPSLLYFNSPAGLVAQGQPIALSSVLQPPAVRWASASIDESYTLTGHAKTANQSRIVWLLEDVSGLALQHNASESNGTVRMPWQLSTVAAAWPGADVWVDVSLRGSRGSQHVTSAFQVHSCRASMRVRYDGDPQPSDCGCGSELSPATTAVPPIIVQLADAIAPLYVIMLIDRDALSWQQPTLSPLLHAAYADVPAARLAEGVDLRAERALAAYMGPAGLGPGSYAAPHRYSWRLYAQRDPSSRIEPFPIDFDRTGFALDTWLAANGVAPQPEADESFRAEAALPDHSTCDGALEVHFGGGPTVDCTTALRADVVAEAPLLRFKYPYFEDELSYALVAVAPATSTLLWLVCNIGGALINSGTQPESSASTSVLVPYAHPGAGQAVLLLLYVQPGPLAATVPISSRKGFDAAAWAASVGIARPSASNGFRVSP